MDWTEYMERYVSDFVRGGDLTFSKVSSRMISNGMWMPTEQNNVINHIGMAFDTSGSVMDEELQEGLKETMRIAELYGNKVSLIGADSRVCSHQTFEKEDLPITQEEVKLQGGGGTSIAPTFNYIDEEDLGIDLLVYFSDMEVTISDYPDDPPDYPVIWLSTTPYPYTDPPFGEMICIKSFLY